MLKKCFTAWFDKTHFIKRAPSSFVSMPRGKVRIKVRDDVCVEVRIEVRIEVRVEVRVEVRIEVRELK